MKKKLYISPSMKVMEFRSDLMKMTGPASMPAQMAPQRHEKVF